MSHEEQTLKIGTITWLFQNLPQLSHGGLMCVFVLLSASRDATSKPVVFMKNGAISCSPAGKAVGQEEGMRLLQWILRISSADTLRDLWISKSGAILTRKNKPCLLYFIKYMYTETFQHYTPVLWDSRVTCPGYIIQYLEKFIKKMYIDVHKENEYYQP